MTLDSKSVISGFMVLGILSAVACARGQGITLRDDFETGTLSSIWTTEKMPPNAMRHIAVPTRNGRGAIEICVSPQAMAAVGADGQLTERAEIREAPGVRLKMGMASWYAFSFYLPSDFPIVDTRLVIARWKQSFSDTWKDRSPMIALRYMGGRLIVDVSRDRGKRRLYNRKVDLRGRWIDMVFHILPRASKKIPPAFKDGILQVWMGHDQIVDYRGALGFVDDEDEIYFKLGLYRDHMDIPMRIVYDRYRRGPSFEAVRMPNH